MQLVTQSYDAIELQRIRSELERRKIAVHVSDEFTYAIPGMPGAEQPRGIWVDDEDLIPAQRVVRDLLGEHRLAGAETSESTAANSAAGGFGGQKKLGWFWAIAALIALLVIISNLTR